MRSLLTCGANMLWYLACLPQSLAFHYSTRSVAEAQQRLLRSLLRRNAASKYGRQYDFASIRTIAEYQERVPLTNYDDYHPWIARIGDGEPGLLTSEPVLLLEPTSGSTSATKLIPYTASLKAEFQRGIAPWIADLYSHHPALVCGQAYWSVTPVTRHNERSGGGLPIGFEEESEYLSRWQSALTASVFAVPPLVKLIGEMEPFRYVTLLFLLRSRRLALISVWNPTFLSLLVSRLAEWGPSLAEDIARGTISAPIAERLQLQLRRLNRPDEERAAELTRIFQSAATPRELHTRIWPKLRLISCWSDAYAAAPAQELAQLFPQAQLQGKGLIATESFITFPLMNRDGAVLAVRSHFFEFLPVDQSAASPQLAHEIKSGARYAVVVTTGGGLYRYQLNDLVEVTGFYANCPLLRFIGKEDHISDWFGEKLNAVHVGRVITDALADCDIASQFAILACESENAPPAYTLFLEAAKATPDSLRALGRAIEVGLQENFHYRYCRELGQLGAARVFRIEGGAMESYLSTCMARGQRAGDIKPMVLHKDGGWAQVFRGRWI
jgi:hypothetical protein